MIALTAYQTSCVCSLMAKTEFKNYATNCFICWSAYLIRSAFVAVKKFIFFNFILSHSSLASAALAAWKSFVSSYSYYYMYISSDIFCCFLVFPCVLAWSKTYESPIPYC